MSSAALNGSGDPGGIHAPGRHGGAHRLRRTQPARGSRVALRLVTGAAAVAVSAVVLKQAMAVRNFEAWLSGHLVSLVTGIQSGSVVDAPIIWFADGPHRYMGLLVTSECTVDALFIPFTIGTAWVIWRQLRLLRPLLGLAVAVALLLGMNQLRLLLIVVLTVRFGYQSGFYWGHTLIGSLITVFGVVLIFIVFLLIAVRRKGYPARRKSHANKPPAI